MRQIVLNDNPTAALSPAEKVVEAFGELRTAEIVELTIDAIRKWRRRRATGGTGGLVPSQYQARLLRAAEEQNLPLTAADFIAEPY